MTSEQKLKSSEMAVTITHRQVFFTGNLWPAYRYLYVLLLVAAGNEVRCVVHEGLSQPGILYASNLNVSPPHLLELI